ncbi:Histone H1 [Termitomyces sp. J132]|nr:Histone H1 [Termitomyces sp. J132]
MSAKKVSGTKTAKKGAAAKATLTHPSWVDMIKDCIAQNPEDARSGVSRQQIKKYVEDKYKLEIGPAQTTQLSRTLATWSEKGVFVLPKTTFSGPSGRVKLAPKSRRADSSDSKENKPATKPRTAPKPKAAEKSSAVKAATAKSTARPASKSVPKTYSTKGKSLTRKTAAPATKATTIKKPVARSAKPASTARKVPAKKVLAGKAKTATTAKKTTAPSKRGSVKKTVTGVTATTKAKAAAKKAPVKKAAVTKSAKPAAKPAAKAAAKPAAKSKTDFLSNLPRLLTNLTNYPYIFDISLVILGQRIFRFLSYVQDLFFLHRFIVLVSYSVHT